VTPELVELVDAGRLPPRRAIDLGCGTGANSAFLAQRGFEMERIAGTVRPEPWRLLPGTAAYLMTRRDHARPAGPL
jgi:methylase of polypeptide subunit release factors